MGIDWKSELKRIVSGGTGGLVFGPKVRKIIESMTQEQARVFVQVINNAKADGKRQGRSR